MQQQNQEMQQNDAPASQQGLTETPPPAPIAEPVASQPSREDELRSRLAQVEAELEKAMEVVRSVESAAGAMRPTPVEHLLAAKQLLMDAESVKPSQNNKDAIQNINYALAACRRELV